MNRGDMSGLVGRKVAIRLTNVEARGVELVATLEEVREDGIVLSEVGELGPGPTMFCPWASLHQVRERPPWLRPPHEEPGNEAEDPAGDGSFEVREVPAEEVPEPSLERRRFPSARNLERVVPIAQRRAVGDVTVALASLELYGEGVGALRWRVSLGESAFREAPDFGFDIPEPVFEIRDGDGRELSWSPESSGASDDEANGDVRVEGLPETGELEVEVPRLVADAYEGGEYVGDGPSYDGPWVFRFPL
ncbi:MAG: hypothetical protein AVDCRST_MAG12-1520 [uncultured Rubrobacteraceae bacterium]|uniref:Uncharacterized protein n=1 Tax=uncultured Rubrobacteraceae bacterium TaxID=349277 RepID=A0A6J4S1T5_9ACTN|nr:MAG: hypothetical protein AVDCRST_MAG12-1520 [uncultured Rubrobacteraceae bacterium]